MKYLMFFAFLGACSMSPENPCNWSETHNIYHEASNGCVTKDFKAGAK